jgi:hypothetical protein
MSFRHENTVDNDSKGLRKTGVTSLWELLAARMQLSTVE